MDHRRLSFVFIVCAWASLALAGCSQQEEHLEADAVVSPFYPSQPDKDRDASGKMSGKALSDGVAAKGDVAGPGPGEAPTTDARFGTNEVERQLRIALRTAQKGDPAVAADLL